MANQATSTYRVSGTRKAVSDLWNTLQSMNVNTKNIWLDDLAKFHGIDYEAKHISVRGHIYWAEYEEDEDHVLLSFETETAWDACNEMASITIDASKYGLGILQVEQDKEFEPCKLSAIKDAELQEFLAHLYDE